MKWWLVAVAALVSCRAVHESLVLQRVSQARLAQAGIPRPLAECEDILHSLPAPLFENDHSLLLTSNETRHDGAHVWCFTWHEQSGCFEATAQGQETRLTTSPLRPPSGALTRAVWAQLDPAGALAGGAEVTAEELSALAENEEATFERRWSFTAGARSGGVHTALTPAFTFGGHLGARYWVSHSLLPGLAVEVESVLHNSRTLLTVAPQARLELTVWRDDNARFANLPNLTFLMAVEPLIGFGSAPAVGARAVIGVHLMRVGNFITPFFIEAGFQALTVDGASLTGLRVAIGLGV